MNRDDGADRSEINEYGQRVGRPITGWQTKRRPERTTLTGRYVTLEPLTTAHAPDLHATLCDVADRPLWTYRPTEPPSDPAAMAAFIEPLTNDTQTVTWAIRPLGGKASGMTTFMRIDPETGQVEVAAVIYSKTMQKTPESTEATSLLMRYAFDELGYRRFEWKCDSFNEPSQRAALRLGFRYEGRFRNHMITRNRSRDTDWFSVDCDEWVDVRRAHDTWLAPENFDATGRQRHSLSALTARLPVRRDLVPGPEPAATYETSAGPES